MRRWVGREPSHRKHRMSPRRLSVEVERGNPVSQRARVGAGGVFVHLMRHLRERAVGERLPGRRNQFFSASHLQIGDRAGEGSRRFVDLAEVVGERTGTLTWATMFSWSQDEVAEPDTKALPHSGSYSLRFCGGPCGGSTLAGLKPAKAFTIGAGISTGKAFCMSAKSPIDHWSPSHLFRRANTGPIP